MEKAEMGKLMFKLRHLLFLLALASLHSPSKSSTTSIPTSVLAGDLPQLCNVRTIPYPFGISGLSPFLPGFNITCNLEGGFPRLSLGNRFSSTEVRLLNISLLEGFLRVEVGPNSWHCARSFSEAAGILPNLLEGSPYTFSPRNMLTVIGCDAMVTLRDHGSNRSSGCVSFCLGTESLLDGLCSGVGCCQAAIPRNLKTFDLDSRSIRNLTGSSENLYNNDTKIRCSRAFILEQPGTFVFSKDQVLNSGTVGGAPWPVVLDWSIGNMPCDEAKRSRDGYICAEKAECTDSSSGIGYLCRCKDGYDGNPYLKEGCKDIDECRDVATSPCERKCTNKDGSYHCSCPFGTSGDGTKQGSGCKRVAPIEIALTAGLCLLLLLFIGGLLSYRKLKNRSIEKMKQQNFMQNGGLFLQKHLSVRGATPKIFSTGELETATNKFSESRILGRGGYGTVYKGTLCDGREVAIKKSKLLDETQIEQFVNEMVILSQINHRNVVKLLGCCLETQVPLLVYEFISNGTLFEHIHSDRNSSPLTWEIRLRIAEETAAALAYLHKAASIPIIHRDVKSTNILLDEFFTAKVSDFGASRLVPYNQSHVTTVVQGTLGYLDPEYFHTGLLTEKSDVYSFGVVLVELLTREKPVSFGKSEARNLASHFVGMMENNCLLDAVDPHLVVDAGYMSLSAAAELARRCLNVTGEDRPMMKEVAVELNALRRLLMLSRLTQQLGGEGEGLFLYRSLE